MRARVAGAIGAAALVLAGCAHLPFGHKGVPRGGETITFSYSTPLCPFGPPRCANYTVTLGPDGQGILTRRDLGPDGADRRFQATPAQVAAFSTTLRPYRPNGELLYTDGASCRHFVTDGDKWDVRWTGSDGKPAHLSYDGGCDYQKHKVMADALRSAPSLLPIADLIGPH